MLSCYKVKVACSADSRAPESKDMQLIVRLEKGPRTNSCRRGAKSGSKAVKSVCKTPQPETSDSGAIYAGDREPPPGQTFDAHPSLEQCHFPSRPDPIKALVPFVCSIPPTKEKQLKSVSHRQLKHTREVNVRILPTRTTSASRCQCRH